MNPTTSITRPDMNVTMETNYTNISQNTHKCGPLFPIEEDCIIVGFFLNTIIGGIICVVGLIGNSVSFAVLSKDKQTPIASMLLQALAFADNFFLICWLVHIALRYLLLYVGVESWSSPVWGPIHIYLYPFLFIGQTCTIWLTVFIAFTRYFAVCRPYSAVRIWNTKTIRTGIIAIFITSFLYNIPRFFEYKLVYNYEYCDKIYHPPDKWLRKYWMYTVFYFDVTYYIFIFLLPLVLLAVLNIRLIVAYREVQRRRQRMVTARGSISCVTTENGREVTVEAHRDPNITLVMIIVIVVFMLCNLPAKLVQIFLKYEVHPCFSIPNFLQELSNVLEALNSSSNFAVYCVFRHQFRTILRQGPCCQPMSPTTQSHANQTDIQATQCLLNGHAKTHQTTCQDTKV